MAALELLMKVPGQGDSRSPFEEALGRVAEGSAVDLACPYLSMDVLARLLGAGGRFRLVTDAEEWLRAFARSGRAGIIDFIRAHHGSVRHYRDLHAKVALSPTLAMLGSANFTERGLFERQEVGVLISNRAQIREVRLWFDAVWKSAVPIDVTLLRTYAKSLPKAGAERGLRKRRLPAPNVEPQRRARWPSTGPAWSLDSPERLIWYLARLRSRTWCEQLFDAMRALVVALDLEASDRRLVTSMQRDQLAIGVTINNRWALGVVSDPNADDRSANVYVLDPEPSGTKLPVNVLRSVVDVGYYGSRPGDYSSPPGVLIMRDLSFTRSRTFQRGEPPRVCRRLRTVRGWSHEQSEPILAGSA